MRFPTECKVELVTSRDQPHLAHAYLRIKETVTGRGKSRKTVRTGFLEATDSMRLVRIPVVLDDDDKPGFVPCQAIAAARRHAGEISVSGSIVVSVRGGQLVLDEPIAPSPYPDLDKVLKVIELKPIAFSVSLNPELLQDLAAAMGRGRDRGVILDFEADKDGRPDPLRPIRVRVSGHEDRVGLLMPIRIAS